MLKGVTILYVARLANICYDSMKKSNFGWIFVTKGDDRTVLGRKREKFTDLASVKNYYFPLYFF